MYCVISSFSMFITSSVDVILNLLKKESIQNSVIWVIWRVWAYPLLFTSSSKLDGKEISLIEKKTQPNRKTSKGSVTHDGVALSTRLTARECMCRCSAAEWLRALFLSNQRLVPPSTYFPPLPNGGSSTYFPTLPVVVRTIHTAKSIVRTIYDGLSGF